MSNNAPTLFSSFTDGITGVVELSPASQPRNKHQLVCPRPGCKSIIVKPGVATHVERPSIEIEPPDFPQNPILPPLPTPDSPCHCWRLSPSPMEFENVAFSRTVPSSRDATTPPSPMLQLLACAECDLGPLGWCHQGGTEFWLVCDRVAYVLPG